MLTYKSHYLFDSKLTTQGDKHTGTNGHDARGGSMFDENGRMFNPNSKQI